MTQEEKEELQRLLNDVVEYAENLDDLPNSIYEKIEAVADLVSDLELTSDDSDDYDSIIGDSWD